MDGDGRAGPAVENGGRRLPFTFRVLEAGDTAVSPAAVWKDGLPATFRTRADNIIAAKVDDVEFLQRELLVKRIDAARKYLWVMGRPMPPRPLHHQIVLRRNLVVTEDMELHMVWARERIFVKPLPGYLLDPGFWSKSLLSRIESEPRLREVEACARGFLHSYCALIAYPSDFKIARDMGLLPEEVNWEAWKKFTAELLAGHCYASVSPRFWYGELRLSRLNKVYYLAMGSPLRGYSRVAAHVMMSDLLGDNFAVLASILAYVAIVLTAMQVGLATHRLVDNDAFQNVSYGFTVLSITAPPIVGIGILLAALVMIGSNAAATKSYERRRFEEIGVEPPSKGPIPREPGKKKSAANGDLPSSESQGGVVAKAS